MNRVSLTARDDRSHSATRRLLAALVLMAGLLIAFAPGAQAQSTVKIAGIGDFGLAGQPESDVANLVMSWNPDYVMTYGDDNYPSGGADTIDANIGQYYRSFIYPYTGKSAREPPPTASIPVSAIMTGAISIPIRAVSIPTLRTSNCRTTSGTTTGWQAHTLLCHRQRSERAGRQHQHLETGDVA